MKLFFLMRDRHQARVLSSIGYSTRKLGDIDKGIDYYRQALAIHPTTPKFASTSARLTCKRATSQRRGNSSWRSLTAAVVRETTMNF